ncbi:MAG: hypothetical protein ACOC16_02015 [Nanoarchaeota archaeon]
MVDKKTFYDLYIEKAKKPISDIKDNKNVLNKYLSEIEQWFYNLKSNEIDKKKFELFFEYFQDKTLNMLADLKHETKIVVSKIIIEYLNEIKEHSTLEIKHEIKQLINKIDTRNDIISRIKRIEMSFFTQIILVILLIMIVVIGLHSFVVNKKDMHKNYNIDEVNPQPDIKDEDSADKNQVNNKNENQSDDDNQELKQDGLNDIQEDEIITIKNDVLNKYEKVVFEELNKKRVEYNLNELIHNMNYSELLDKQETQISKKLNIKKFVYLYEEEVLIDNDENAIDIYKSIDKKNIFSPDYNYIGINIEKLKYRIYLVQLALY